MIIFSQLHGSSSRIEIANKTFRCHCPLSSTYFESSVLFLYVTLLNDLYCVVIYINRFFKVIPVMPMYSLGFELLVTTALLYKLCSPIGISFGEDIRCYYCNCMWCCLLKMLFGLQILSLLVFWCYALKLCSYIHACSCN